MNIHERQCDQVSTASIYNIIPPRLSNDSRIKSKPIPFTWSAWKVCSSMKKRHLAAIQGGHSAKRYRGHSAKRNEAIQPSATRPFSQTLPQLAEKTLTSRILGKAATKSLLISGLVVELIGGCVWFAGFDCVGTMRVTGGGGGGLNDETFNQRAGTVPVTDSAFLYTVAASAPVRSLQYCIIIIR